MSDDFWKTRAKSYNKLDWVTDDDYLKCFVGAASFVESDLVLDVGTGTGVLANVISPLVKEVIGLDLSRDMLDRGSLLFNEYFVRGDIRDPFFASEVFDKVTARMVFHHIVLYTQKAMDECYKVLKKGGLMILSEGVPPSLEVRKDYEEIFCLKEDRLTFFEDDLFDLMEQAGFKNIKVKSYVMKGFSVKNWLVNSGLSQDKQDKIFELHIASSEVFKKAYNLSFFNDDCLIDVKNLILVGEK